MKALALPCGTLTTYDGADTELVAAHKWYLSNGYVRCANPSGAGRGRPMLYMHRVIMGASKLMQVDHINGDKLDNRRANLRLCSPWQNAQNRTGSGVTFTQGRWCAQMTHNYRHMVFGYFATPEAACAAYQTAIKLLRGPFARELHTAQFETVEP